MPGTYAPRAGLSACISCAMGQYQKSSHAQACHMSTVGHEPNAGATDQVLCSAGTHNDVGGSVCKPCTPGTYATGTGHKNCSCASAGHETKSNRTQQAACAKGYFSTSTCTDKCLQCGHGKFSSNVGAHGEHLLCFLRPLSSRNHEKGSPQACLTQAPESTCTKIVWRAHIARVRVDDCTMLCCTAECACVASGHTPNVDRTDQEWCPPGTFAEHNCSKECTRCARGSFRGQRGGSVCECASKGHTSNDNRTKEVPCEAGTRNSPSLRCTDRSLAYTACLLQVLSHQVNVRPNVTHVALASIRTCPTRTNATVLQLDTTQTLRRGHTSKHAVQEHTPTIDAVRSAHLAHRGLLLRFLAQCNVNARRLVISP